LRQYNLFIIKRFIIKKERNLYLQMQKTTNSIENKEMIKNRILLNKPDLSENTLKRYITVIS